MSTRIALEKIIAQLGFLHVVELYDDQKLLLFVFALLEIDNLKGVTLSKI